MNENFIRYLKAIGLVGPLIDRISSVMDTCQQICPETLTDIFVSEYMKEDGTREYENLWFFSEGYCVEAKSFILTISLDCAPWKKMVVNLRVECKDYDFKKATEKSRLNATFAIRAAPPSGLVGILKASKENCDYMKDILNKYLIPNYIE